MVHHFLCNGTSLNNRTVRSKVTLENSNTACLAVWICNRANDVCVLDFTTLNVLAYSLACCRDKVCVKKSNLCKLVHYGINTACLVEILHICVTCRSKVTKVRSLFADFIGNVKVKLNTCLFCDCRKVEHCIC